MGLGTRIFFVNDNDSLRRVPLAKFERLRKGEECFPEYAGQRIRYVFAVLEVENRKPIGIYKIQYPYLPFDSKGRIDAAEREKAAMLAVNMVPPLPSEQEKDGVIEAQHKFAKKRYDELYSWTPKPKIEAAIAMAIFGKRLMESD
jgi:hypothetical protein